MSIYKKRVENKRNNKTPFYLQRGKMILIDTIYHQNVVWDQKKARTGVKVPSLTWKTGISICS